MFKKYGVLGIVLIILVELNFFFKVQPFANWYFPLVWFGYILVVDALVYSIRKESLISNRFYRFLGLLLLSVLFWYSFEFLNIFVGNWAYSGGEVLGIFRHVHRILAFSTVLPALFETTELIRTVHLFDKIRLKRKHNITKAFLHVIMLSGVACFIAPVFLPAFAYPLVWLSFFLILDPVNYLNKQPSIIGHLKDRRLAVPLSLLLAGIILGFLWEFWNYWAVIKWSYDIPFLGFFKVFEMPVLGYLGYFPFSFELYAMYWFVRGLFARREGLLV